MGNSAGLLWVLAAVSVFGLALTPLLLLQPNLQADPLDYRRPLVSAVYCVICIAGVAAVFYPGKCRMMFQKPTVSPDNPETGAELAIRGHHPDCVHFSQNRLQLGERVFCAACSGLLVGAVVAVAGSVLFALGFITFESGIFWVLLLGEGLMLLGVAQIKTGGYIKAVFNALFVVGSFFMVVATDFTAQSLLVDAYVLGIIVLTLILRILLSEWENKKRCLACGRCV